MSEPLAYTSETRAAAEVEALKRELAGAKQRQAASVDLDDVAKALAAAYVKDVTEALAAVTGPAVTSGPKPTAPTSS